MICPGGNLRERMVGGRPRDFGDVGYLGVLLNIQVSDRTFSEQMQACENHLRSSHDTGYVTAGLLSPSRQR